jgi:membrane protein implicated in regulation of membrane protease activity
MKQALTIGEAFISQKSGHVGVIEEIVHNSNGSYRVKFEDGRWTTVS